jgi:hypothetical protein
MGTARHLTVGQPRLIESHEIRRITGFKLRRASGEDVGAALEGLYHGGGELVPLNGAA